MERKVGEVFTYNGKTYQVVQFISCKGCAFNNIGCDFHKPFIGSCLTSERTDKTNVIFKEINNMKIKNNQLTIDIPKGMEIDLKNSDLTKGIVKFKKNDITYENVEDALKLGKNCKNENNASKLVALSRLMNIAKYYNRDWKPNKTGDSSGYCIKLSYIKAKYAIERLPASNYGIVTFKNKEDAEAVIDNPNFRDILDTIFK